MNLKFYNNLIGNTFLTRYDLGSKYNIKNIYIIPTIKNITVEMPIMKSLEQDFLESDDLVLQIRFFLYLYILFGINPFIKKSNFLKKLVLQLTLHKKIEINKFLNFLFIDNFLNSENYLASNIKLEQKKNTLIIQIKSSIILFPEISDFIQNSNIEAKLKKLTESIYININFKNIEKVLKPNFFLKNFFF